MNPDQRDVALVVCSHAVDSDDARRLLATLGLLDAPPRRRLREARPKVRPALLPPVHAVNAWRRTANMPTACVDCGRPLRRRHEEREGAVQYAALGRCGSCYRRSRRA